jgi:hypothetical protein
MEWFNSFHLILPRRRRRPFPRCPLLPEEHMGESQAEAWAASFGKAIPQRHVFGGPEREVRRNFNERPNKRGMGLRIESHPLLIAETRCDGRLPTSLFLTSSEVLNKGMKFPIRPSKNTSGFPVYLGYGFQRPRVFRRYEADARMKAAFQLGSFIVV